MSTRKPRQRGRTPPSATPVVPVAAPTRRAYPRGAPLTDTVTNWTAVLPVPPYPDWPSGHGTLTGAFAETVRCHLGDIPLTLNGNGDPRTYSSLAVLEHDAFMSRIWGGIHFRNSLDVSDTMGRQVANYVVANSMRPVR